MNRLLLNVTALALGASVLVGCTVFPTPEPPRVMDLAVPSHDYRAPSTSPQSLRIDTPHASGLFNTTQILAKPTPLEFRIYPGVRWRDTIPIMTRDLLLEALRASHGFRNVVNDTSQAEADWTMISELSAFHTENYRSDTQAVIQLHAQILSNRSRETLCSQSFRVSDDVAGKTPTHAVEAFAAAGGKLSEAIARWAAGCVQDRQVE